MKTEELINGYDVSLNDETYINDLKSRLNGNFDVIYYQSGLDKATNDFNDCDSIVLLGDFNVNNHALSDHSYYNDLPEFTMVDYKMQLYVQSIMRTRLRNYYDEPVDAYFSGDFDDRLIRLIGSYIKTGNTYEEVIMSDNKSEVLGKGKISKRFDALISKHPEVAQVILDNSVIDLGWWSKNDLIDTFGIINKSDITDYKSTLSYLKSLGIIIHAYSYRGKYPKVVNNSDDRLFEIYESEVSDYLNNGWSFYKTVTIYE